MEEKSHFLSDLMVKVSGTDKRSSFPVALIIAAVVVIGFGVMIFFLMRARRKAAALASKLRLKEEEKVQLKENLAIAKTKDEIEVTKVNIEALEEEIWNTTVAIKKLDKKNKSRRKAIAAIADWDDIVLVDNSGG